MLDEIFRMGFKYKRAGVIIDHLIHENNIETNMFETPPIKQTNLSKSIDDLNQRFGKNTVAFGSRLNGVVCGKVQRTTLSTNISNFKYQGNI